MNKSNKRLHDFFLRTAGAPLKPLRIVYGQSEGEQMQYRRDKALRQVIEITIDYINKNNK